MNDKLVPKVEAENLKDLKVETVLEKVKSKLN